MSSMIIFLQRSRAMVFAVFWFLAVSLMVGCRQPTIWTPKAPYGATTGTDDFDLTSKENDPNGSPMSPRWAPQDQKPENMPPTPDSTCTGTNAQPYQAGCTDQTKYLVQDVGTGLNGLLCSLFGDSSTINGHADWTVASASGPVGWLNFAEDFDYNLLLVPELEFGLTENNNRQPSVGRYMEIEFDSREFNFGTSWWREFASRAEKGAQSGDFTDIQNWLNEGRELLPYGVVYGIFGIDCEHGCRSEIHPAYAVAIQVNDAKDSNKWAIFARNWGDEGFCSHLNHQLDLSSDQNALHIMLPYSSSAGPKINKEDYEVATGSQAPNQCPSFNFLQGQGEEVTIPLPPPDQEGLTEVFVDFQWPDGASAVKFNQVGKKEVMGMLAARSSAAEKLRPTETTEEHLGRLRRTFTGKRFPKAGFGESILKPYIANLPAAKQQAAQQKKNTSAGCPVPEAASPPTKTMPTAARVKTKLQKLRTHAAKDMWDRAALKDFCDAYEKSGRKLPDEEPADVKAKLDRVCSDKQLRP